MGDGKEPVLLDWAEDGRFGEDVKGGAAAHAECARRIRTSAHTMGALHEDRHADAIATEASERGRRCG